MKTNRTTSPGVQALPPLAQHRSRNGVTLEEIAESTKISLRFLKAIEAEDYAQLPGGIFARSYLRQYAEAIGFDEDELLRRYEDSAGRSEEAALHLLRKAPGTADTPRKRSGLGWMIRALGPLRF